MVGAIMYRSSRCSVQMHLHRCIGQMHTCAKINSTVDGSHKVKVLGSEPISPWIRAPKESKVVVVYMVGHLPGVQMVWIQVPPGTFFSLIILMFWNI